MTDEIFSSFEETIELLDGLDAAPPPTHAPPQMDEAMEALICFHNLFGHAIPTLAPDVNVNLNNSDNGSSDLSIDMSNFTEQQFQELHKMSQLLTCIMQKSFTKSQPARALVDTINNSTRRIIDNQNLNHKSTLEELYHKFSKLEESMIAFTNQMAVSSSTTMIPPVKRGGSHKRVYSTDEIESKLEEDEYLTIASNSTTGKKSISMKQPKTHHSTGKKVSNGAVTVKDEKNEGEVTTTTSTSTTTTSTVMKDSFDFIKDTKVRKKAKELAYTALTFDPKGQPSTLLRRYIYRIFESTIYYGYLAQFEPPFFVVVYNDGDYQRLSVSEVQLSLCEDTLVPEKDKESCMYHIRNQTFLRRTPLPTL